MKQIEKANNILDMLDEAQHLQDMVNEFGKLDLSERQAEAVACNLQIATRKWLHYKSETERAEARIKQLEGE